MQDTDTRAREVVDSVFERFAEMGHRSYSEEVTELQHALQCATLAREHGESDAMVAACLLHDFGHLVHGLDEDIADHGIDGRHEQAGYDALRERFEAQVIEPGRLHVAAKRYLCCRDPEYLAALSPASARSLELQGGPMSEAEATAFESERYWKEALILRKYDDLGKDAEMETPPLESFRDLLTRFVRREV